MKDSYIMVHHYMPFTYASEALIDVLTGCVGPLTVLQPLDSLVPRHMRSAAEKGVLQCRVFSGVNQTLLQRAFKEHTAWAELHSDKIGDMAGFSVSGNYPSALTKEGGTHQIRDQIRKWGSDTEGHLDVALYQDALFLCLAHLYDQHQDAVHTDLRSVDALERKFGQIIGGPEEAAVLSDAPQTTEYDPGLYMTERRVRSWARLTLLEEALAPVFITNSRAVWHYLCDALPAAPFHIRADVTLDTMALGQPADLLSRLVNAQDPRAVLDQVRAGAQDGGRTASFLVLAGVSPREVLARLSQAQADAYKANASDGSGLNTVIGYIGDVPHKH
jgi:hypothetical protein